MLGTPLGTREYVAAHATSRVTEERRLLQLLPRLPDLQPAWLILLLCAVPRANHLLRTTPPTQAQAYAATHDEAVWETLAQFLGEAQLQDQLTQARAALPGRLGGLGLTSARLTSPAAYWAAWADALEVLRQRRPVETLRLVAELERGAQAAAPCLQEAAAAATLLEEEGLARPTWMELANGARPPQPDPEEADWGEWPHGWQYWAARARTNTLLTAQVLPRLQPPERALLRSQSGPGAATWLTALPTEAGTTFPSHLLQVALRRRLRLPLPPRSRWCGHGGLPGCRQQVDPLGDHAAACPRTGLLQRRARPLEHAWTRVAREAVGAEGQVVPQQWLVNTTVRGVGPEDRRRLDLVVHGASATGTALCCDATLVSPLHRNGQARAGAADEDGVALAEARRRKERRYPELLNGGAASLVVLAFETGGRWSRESWHFLRRLVKLRVRRAPHLLRRAAALGWHRRWTCLLSVAAQRALASTLLEPSATVPLGPWGVEEPELATVLQQAGPEPGASRLPLR